MPSAAESDGGSEEMAAPDPKLEVGRGRGARGYNPGALSVRLECRI